MDFDDMLNTWRAQNTAPSYDVNREALRQTLQTEQARVRKEMRTRRRGNWFCGIFATGMAVWAGFWIAITITNGWPAIYAIASGVCIILFALAIGALWLSRAREPEPNFGNTLEDEVRHSLALVDYQLSINGRSILYILAVPAFVVGTLLFSWTVNRSQDIPDSSSGHGWMFLLVIFFVWIFYSAHKQRQKAKPKLELRQQRLRELLASLGARE